MKFFYGGTCQECFDTCRSRAASAEQALSLPACLQPPHHTMTGEYGLDDDSISINILLSRKEIQFQTSAKSKKERPTLQVYVLIRSLYERLFTYYQWNFCYSALIQE